MFKRIALLAVFALALIARTALSAPAAYQIYWPDTGGANHPVGLTNGGYDTTEAVISEDGGAQRVWFATLTGPAVEYGRGFDARTVGVLDGYAYGADSTDQPAKLLQFQGSQALSAPDSMTGTIEAAFDRNNYVAVMRQADQTYIYRNRFGTQDLSATWPDITVTGLNINGTACYNAYEPDGTPEAFWWKPGQQPTLLPVPGGAYGAEVNAMSYDGVPFVIGSFVNNGIRRPYLLWPDMGNFADIGPADQSVSGDALGMNYQGAAVGWLSTSGKQVAAIFPVNGNVPQALVPRIDAPNADTLTEANFVNIQGFVVGKGLRGGQERTFVAIPLPPANTPDKGEVNGDGRVNAGDAIVTLRAIVGQIALTAPQLYAADMNDDGVVDRTDVSLILKEGMRRDFQ